LSGLIIIDFIDMLSFNNRKQVERKLKERCRNDRARIQIGRISNFGLLEMSRQRLRESNIKWSIKLTNETQALKVIKLVEIKSLETNAKIVEVSLNEKILDYLEKNFNEDLNYFKKKNKIKINLNKDTNLSLQEYFVEFKSKSGKVLEKVEKVENLQKIIEDKNVPKQKEDKDKKINYKRKKFKKRQNYKKKKLN